MTSNRLFYAFIIAMLSSITLFADKTAPQESACPCASVENPSPFLKPDTEIRDMATKMSWGQLKSRLPADDGWILSTKKTALDKSYGIKWEVSPKAPPADDNLMDADGKEIFGDNDSLWFKIAPDADDADVYKIFVAIGKDTKISTDGVFNGKLHLFYFDKTGALQTASVSTRIVKYLTQERPLVDKNDGRAKGE